MKMIENDLNIDVSELLLIDTDPLLTSFIGRRALSYLDAADLARSSLTCKTWYEWVYAKNSHILKNNTTKLYMPNNSILQSDKIVGNIKMPQPIIPHSSKEKHVSMDTSPLLSTLPPPFKGLFKWRIQISGIPNKFRYNYWRYLTELEMAEDSDVIHRQPGIFQLFVDQLPPKEVYKTINDDISFFLNYSIIN